MPRGVRAGVVPLTRGPEEHSVPRDHPLGLCASTARLPTGRKNKTPGSPEAWGEAEGPRAGPGTAAAAAAANKAARTKTPSSSSLPSSIPSARYLTPRGKGKRDQTEPPSPGAPQPLCSPPEDSGTKRRAPRTPQRPRRSPPSEGSPARGGKTLSPSPSRTHRRCPPASPPLRAPARPRRRLPEPPPLRRSQRRPPAGLGRGAPPREEWFAPRRLGARERGGPRGPWMGGKGGGGEKGGNSEGGHRARDGRGDGRTGRQRGRTLLLGPLGPLAPLHARPSGRGSVVRGAAAGPASHSCES